MRCSLHTYTFCVLRSNQLAGVTVAELESTKSYAIKREFTVTEATSSEWDILFKLGRKLRSRPGVQARSALVCPSLVYSADMVMQTLSCRRRRQRLDPVAVLNSTSFDSPDTTWIKGLT